MPPGKPDTAARIRGAAGALAAQALFALVLLNGLSSAGLPVPHAALSLFTVQSDPPSPLVPEPRPARHQKRPGAAAPPNLTARPSEVVAPPPILPTPPPPVVAAPVAGPGPDSSAGSSNRPGPGTGAGGVGSGTGSGNEGDGPGAGGTPLEWISGSIEDSDYPRAALRLGVGGTVHLRFTVGVKGRVTDCTVTRSSGNADLDATTCRLIVKRFRYRPTRNAQGRAVPDVVTGEHVWSVYGVDGGDEPER
jgi:protein TonB